MSLNKKIIFILILSIIFQIQAQVKTIRHCGQVYSGTNTQLSAIEFIIPSSDQSTRIEAQLHALTVPNGFQILFDGVPAEDSIIWFGLTWGDPHLLEPELTCSPDANGLSPLECIHGPIEMLWSNGNRTITRTQELIDQEKIDPITGSLLNFPINQQIHNSNKTPASELRLLIDVPANVCKVSIVPLSAQDFPDSVIYAMLVCAEPGSDVPDFDIEQLSDFENSCSGQKFGIVNPCVPDELVKWKDVYGNTYTGNHVSLLNPGEHQVTINYSTGQSAQKIFSVNDCPKKIVSNIIPLDEGCGQKGLLEPCAADADLIVKHLNSNTLLTPPFEVGPGDYQITASWENGCEVTDALDIDCISNIPINQSRNQCGQTQLSTCIESDSIKWFGPDHQMIGQGSNINVSKSGQYSVQVETENGCTLSGSAMVTVYGFKQQKIFIPNAFSPNQDGINDVFRPFGQNIHIDHFKIFDRWGALLFEKNNFNTNETDGWNGKVHGKDAENGIYTYFVQYQLPSCGSLTSSGGVTLLR